MDALNPDRSRYDRTDGLIDVELAPDKPAKLRQEPQVREVVSEVQAKPERTGYHPDRSQYPSAGPDGSLDIDLTSGKYLKLWQGPQHPGITGNMSLELTVCGDEIVHARTHVGYLHRGFEKLMERRTFIQCFPIVCRICVPEPDFNEYCYAQAVEELAGIQAPERARWIRAMILEMGRINSYMMYLGGQSGALGLGVIGQWTTYARESCSTGSRSSPARASTTCSSCPAACATTCPTVSASAWRRRSARSSPSWPISRTSCSATPCSRSARWGRASFLLNGSSPTASPGPTRARPGS